MDYVADAAKVVEEVMPWDLEEELKGGATPLILDIREPYEFDCMHIGGSSNVPRGVLESACEWDYEETIPELVNSRDKTDSLPFRTPQSTGWLDFKRNGIL